jgi:glycosyltransferase involved in cell wall biosynthesis
MKILLAAASFASKMSGLQRHALNVAGCLLLEPEISALHLVFAPWQRHFVQAAGFRSDPRLVTHIAQMGRSSLSRNLWYYRDLPELAARLEADLVHFSYPMPVNGAAFSCPTMVTLHDLYPYEIPMNFGFPKFIFNRMVLRQCLRKVDAVACVSDTTLLRLRQYTPPSVWQKATRIYNCVETEPDCIIKTPIQGWQGERFLLSVAQHRRNKNIPLLMQSFHRLLRSGQIPADLKLLVIGIEGPETDRIRRLVSTLGLSGSTSFREGVSESELKWCYAQCEAVVCPSLTEGFGLPIAEALLAGCRVVCSDIPVFREVGDGHCRFVALDGNVEEALAAAIEAALNDPKGPQKALQQFSAPVLAKQYTSLYRRLITSPSPSPNAKVAASINAAASERLPL